MDFVVVDFRGELRRLRPLPLPVLLPDVDCDFDKEENKNGFCLILKQINGYFLGEKWWNYLTGKILLVIYM